MFERDMFCETLGDGSGTLGKTKRQKGRRGMNILILSAGTRDKVVQYFKKELGERGRIIATDCSNLAPAVYEADAFYLVPRITAPGYLDVILDICQKEQITGVFSLIDPELSLAGKREGQVPCAGCDADCF